MRESKKLGIQASKSQSRSPLPIITISAVMLSRRANNRSGNGSPSRQDLVDILREVSRREEHVVSANAAQRKLQTRIAKLTCAKCGKASDTPLQACGRCKSVFIIALLFIHQLLTCAPSLTVVYKVREILQ